MPSGEDSKQRQIRDRAYARWLAEGQPQGRHIEHWLAAESEVAATEEASPGAFRTRKSGARKAPITER